MTGDKVEKATMVFAKLSDLEMAGKVRMLFRDQLDHEAVCVGARDRIMYLSQEVERLTAERDEFKESYRLAIVSVDHAYNKGRDDGRMEALKAVFQINGPSRAITRLKEKYAAEAVRG